MRPILLICALLVVLTVTAAAAPASTSAKHGYLVVRNAAGDGGVSGRPVATVIVKGFVLGRVFREGKVDIIQLPSVNGQGAPQVTPPATTRSIRWHAHGGHVFTGKEFSGSNFRFRALGGSYRVVVRGSSGIYLFAGGRGTVTLRGSSVYPNADGKYSVNGGRFRSLPAKPVTRTIGGG